MIDYSLKLFSYKKLFNHFVFLDQKNNLPSRIIITGQEGIGKTTFAFHLINYLLSKDEINKYDIEENKINTQSVSYNLVKNLSHPNFNLITKSDAKKDIEIEQVRRMINFLNKSSFDNNKKIILIDSAEDLNNNSSNALLKSLEESNQQNIFILTHNSNRKILDTIKSRCFIYKLNFNFTEVSKIVSEYFGENIYDDLNDSFKLVINNPNFLINHIKFMKENNLNLNSSDIVSVIEFIISNKSYKKDSFISNKFQTYIEIYFTNMYLKTKDIKYYDNLLKIVTENNMINEFNLDLDSFFIKFEDKFLKTLSN